MIKAAKILRDEYQIHSNVWSVTSFNELARDGMACEEYNRLHPLAEEVKESWVSKQLRGTEGIVVSATDHMRATVNKSVRIFQMVAHLLHWVQMVMAVQIHVRTYVVSLVLMLRTSLLLP